ncbi:hypothetical protein A0H76_1440 [Hepatospora eriocheir]|uniref:Uncharacterized protein n=1 Tax=Hepatospora eriocheir TaxID=1081669 RepID=A0A1X0QH42_9MICR|nr:hypothetical protein A0H76_1440 [Hepatospora eriocheir]
MTSGLITKLNLKPNKLSKATQVTIGNGSIVKINRKMNLTFSLGLTESIIFNQDFLIINNLNLEIIIGKKFFKRNDAIVSFKDHEIKIGNQTFEMLKWKMIISS